MDPWSSGGVLENISSTVIAIVIEEAAHHLDLRSSNPADPQSVIDARASEVSYIQQWIDEYKNQKAKSAYKKQKKYTKTFKTSKTSKDTNDSHLKQILFNRV